jgi:putative transposase
LGKNQKLLDGIRKERATDADAIPLRPAENQGATMVDLGVSAMATLSRREKVLGPKPHRALLKRLGRLSRNLLRKKKGSANRTKAKAWICKAACPYCQHPAGRLAQAQVRSYATVSSHRHRGAERARHEEEPEFALLPIRHGFLRVSETTGIQGRKAWWFGACRWSLVSVQQELFGMGDGPRNTAAGHLPVGVPGVWKHPRQVNAARNILEHGLAVLNGPMASSAKCEAGGEENSGRRRMTMVKLSSVKQEVSFVLV